jgi:hypothetical protein
MRAVLATALALTIALSAAAPHLHVGVHGAEECAVCVVRAGGDVARPQTPDVAPLDLPAGEVAQAPAQPATSGAPLGAIPGQSPPVA